MRRALLVAVILFASIAVAPTGDTPKQSFERSLARQLPVPAAEAATGGSVLSEWVTSRAWIAALPVPVRRPDRPQGSTAGATRTRAERGYRTEVSDDLDLVLAQGGRDDIVPAIAAGLRVLLETPASRAERFVIREWLEGRDHLRVTDETADRTGDLLLLSQSHDTWGTRVEGGGPPERTRLFDHRVSVRVAERPR